MMKMMYYFYILKYNGILKLVLILDIHVDILIDEKVLIIDVTTFQDN